MDRRKFLWTAGTGLACALPGQGAPPQRKEPEKDKVRLPDSPVVSAPFSPMEIGTSAQLFVERSIVSHTERVWFTLHPGEKHPRNPLMRADRDWEGWRIKTYGNAIYDRDEKLFKMWYDSEPPAGYFPQGHDYSYYAVSHDGLAWEKPLVGTVPSLKPGFRHNVVLECQHANVIKDYADPDPARRYKAVVDVRPIEGERVHPKHTFTSPDGLRWSRSSTKALVDGVGDVTTAYHDEYRRIWVAFIKRPVIVRGRQRRAFSLMTSKNFADWTAPEPVFVPDYDDDASSMARIERVRPLLGVPDNRALIRTEIYGVGGYSAESCTVAFPWVFTVNNAGKYGSTEGPIEIQLAASRDLMNWQRHFRAPCITQGRIGEWDTGLFYTQSKAVRYNDEIRLYYSAANFTHDFANSPDNANQRVKTTSIGLATWKLDRFVSADAGAEGGILTTVPFTHTGRQLELNARVQPGGSIRVEFLDAAGRPIQEAGLSSSCTGDNLRSRIVWSNKEIVDRVRGKLLSLRFHLRRAELYSFAFRA